MILQKASSQHILRLPWCSGRSAAEHLLGSTSQFSSDSYRALMNSPAAERAGGGGEDPLGMPHPDPLDPVTAHTRYLVRPAGTSGPPA